jgi:hypothetical protein
MHFYPLLHDGSCSKPLPASNPLSRLPVLLLLELDSTTGKYGTVNKKMPQVPEHLIVQSSHLYVLAVHV